MGQEFRIVGKTYGRIAGPGDSKEVRHLEASGYFGVAVVPITDEEAVGRIDTEGARQYLESGWVRL